MNTVIDHKTTFTLRKYYPNRKMVHSAWLPTTDLMDAESFKKEMLDIATYYEKIRPESLLSDAREMAFIITPDLQEWIAKTISPRFAGAGIRKIAFILPKDIFAQLGLEQMIEESTTQKSIIDVRYFDDLEKAIYWVS